VGDSGEVVRRFEPDNQGNGGRERLPRGCLRRKNLVEAAIRARVAEALKSILVSDMRPVGPWEFIWFAYAVSPPEPSFAHFPGRIA
jgi:hypothetical protein